MKKVTNIDMIIDCKKASTAINKFMKKYPGHEEWKETYEWMYETGTSFFCDNTFGDGTRNEEWSYALHFVVNENSYYIALIERA